MSKKLLGIHGLANKPPHERLEEWWAQSIRDGLENIGAGDIDFEFELTYWRDKIYEASIPPSRVSTSSEYGNII